MPNLEKNGSEFQSHLHSQPLPKPSINANAQPIKHKEMTKLESRPSLKKAVKSAGMESDLSSRRDKKK